jgi:sugar transferase (PEP-CTERM system associated)
MIRLFRHHIPLGSVVTITADAMLLLAAVPMAVMISSEASLRGAVLGSTAPAVVFALLMLALNSSLGLYRREAGSGLATHVGRVLLSVGIGVPLAYVLFSVIPDAYSARQSLGFTMLYTLAGLILLRQFVFWASYSGLGAKRVLVVGTGSEAAGVSAALETLGYPAMAIVGYYPTGQEGEARAVPNDRILPRNLSLPEVVQGLGVQEVIVAVREQRGGVLPLRELLDIRISGVPVADLAGLYERVRGEVPLESLKASWLIYGQGFAQDTGRTVVKRAFDITCSILLLAVAAPVMAITALVVKMESKGPAIYRQERVGLGGRRFMCLKFRSMRSDAESDGVAKWAQKNDSRITRVGNVIRKTRIDELPQLLNVLRGEMSFVGPRPERPTFVDQLKRDIPFYDVRHCVKPGLTGWAQVRYSYGASVEDSRKKLQFDLYYVKNHSLFLDLVVLLDTIRVVLFREGAH